jgi:integrase
MELWLEDKKLETAPSTYRKYCDVVKRVLEFFGPRQNEDLNRISTLDIKKFRLAEANRVSASSANLTMKILRSVLREAYKQNLIQSNPADRVGRIESAEPTVSRRAFTQEELKKLVKAADGEWKGIIHFGYYTGQRLGDIATLTWKNVDPIKRELSFFVRKTGKPHRVAIADGLMDFIETMPAGENPAQPLFPKAHETVIKTGRTAGLSNQFYNLMVEAGLVPPRPHIAMAIGRKARRRLNDLSFHGLRHTTTSILKNAGITAAVTQEIVGHDSPAISQLYTHIETETLRKAVNVMPLLGE